MSGQARLTGGLAPVTEQQQRPVGAAGSSRRRARRLRLPAEQGLPGNCLGCKRAGSNGHTRSLGALRPQIFNPVYLLTPHLQHHCIFEREMDKGASELTNPVLLQTLTFSKCLFREF